jgi:hypothetical protein
MVLATILIMNEVMAQVAGGRLASVRCSLSFEAALRFRVLPDKTA